MKVSKAVARQNRKRILKAAAKRFRQNGLDGISIAGLMRDAGLTHGGFYGHFASKDDLVADACADCLDEKNRQWTNVIAKNPKCPLQAVVKIYLGRRHRDDPGWGCPLAALGPEASRQSRKVRQAMTGGFQSLVRTLETAIQGSSKHRRQKSLAAWAALLGAIVLARAVDDREFSQEILDATADAVLQIARS